ncbi:hypothetical protein C8R43DRAFT_955743 [Mycena crocata]|nr:hypothetical protein C8R43DRAFT_955743 [Mycena crocata]
MRDLANLVEGYVEAPALAGVFCNADEEAGRAVPGLFWNEVMVAVPTSAPPCKSLLNALLHRGTRFADPGRYRAYDAWLRMDPLARDGERGWGGSWLPAFDWRARAGRGFNSAGARSSRFLTNLTTRAGWRARGSKAPRFFWQTQLAAQLGEHIQLAASDKRRIFSQNYKEIVKKHAMGPVHNHQVVEMRVQRLDPAHAQRAHGAPPQADTLPLNRPPGLLPLLQQPQPNGMPPYTPNGPSQMFFTGIGPPYPFPFLPPQPQSDGVLPQFPPQFPPGIFPFRPNLPGLPQWPQTIVPLGPMTVFEEKVIVTALFDAGFRGVTPKVALDALHGTQGIPAHVWKDRYLDHKEGFDALVCSLRASANPGPTAVPNPPFPQGNTTAPAAATTKTPIYSRTEQAPESKGRPSVYPSRSTPPASVNVRTVKKPHYPRIKQSPPPLPESESESEGKSSSARPARSAAKLTLPRAHNDEQPYRSHGGVHQKLPPPSNQIRIPKTPSKEPTPPTGLTTQTSPTKFTDEEEDFFIGFILWSLQQDPGLTKSELSRATPRKPGTSSDKAAKQAGKLKATTEDSLRSKRTRREWPDIRPIPVLISVQETRRGGSFEQNPLSLRIWQQQQCLDRRTVPYHTPLDALIL